MATLKRSLFIATLDSLDTPHYLSPAIGHAAAATSDSLVVILLSPLFDLQVPVPPISRTERWDDIQRILAHVYVQATKVAQDNGRILMDVNVLLRGCEQPLRADLATEAEVCFLVEGGTLPPIVAFIQTDLLSRKQYPVASSLHQKPATDNSAYRRPSKHATIHQCSRESRTRHNSSTISRRRLRRHL